VLRLGKGERAGVGAAIAVARAGQQRLRAAAGGVVHRQRAGGGEALGLHARQPQHGEGVADGGEAAHAGVPNVACPAGTRSALPRWMPSSRRYETHVQAWSAWNLASLRKSAAISGMPARWAVTA